MAIHGLKVVKCVKIFLLGATESTARMASPESNSLCILFLKKVIFWEKNMLKENET